MDADPLYHVKQLFYQGRWREACPHGAEELTDSFLQRYIQSLFFSRAALIIPACVAEASSSDLGLPARLYAARSHLALSPPNTPAAKELVSSAETPGAKAVLALGRYLADEDKAARVDEVRDLVIESEGADEEEETEEAVIRAIAGTVFILEGENEEAIATLTEGKAKEDLEW